MRDALDPDSGSFPANEEVFRTEQMPGLGGGGISHMLSWTSAAQIQTQLSVLELRDDLGQGRHLLPSHCGLDRHSSDCPTLSPRMLLHTCPNTHLRILTSAPCNTRLSHLAFLLEHCLCSSHSRPELFPRVTPFSRIFTRFSLLCTLYPQPRPPSFVAHFSLKFSIIMHMC